MQVERTEFESLLIVRNRQFCDVRGSFFELFHNARYEDVGIAESFVQDNISISSANTLRGLHYQFEQPQAKLVTVLEGSIFDVAVDLRRSSATFGKYYSRTLCSQENADQYEQILIPVGFAHGFCVTSERAIIHYKCSAHYLPSAERTIAWNDTSVNVAWPIESPIVSDKDARGVPFGHADYFD